MDQPFAHSLSDGSPTTPLGFRAAAVAAGIKQSGRPDLVLVVSDRDCAAAGVFTSNRVAAAPVLLDRETLAAGRAALRGVIINAGNANACTGAPGLADAREMQQLAAAAVGARPPQFLVMSTGVIGVPLPMERVRTGVAAAAPLLSAEGGPAAAEAIMTTDTRPKRAAVEVELTGGRVRLGGMAKGAGMIHPNMATLLGLLTTDAAVAPDDLDALLRDAVAGSFNAISIDGDTSTNDTVLLLANGAAGVALSDAESRARFAAALSDLCRQLAQMIVRDGEGATRVVTLRVTGATSAADARRAADAIATSPLVKTAFAGGDPNWGRILAATGRSGAMVDPDRLSLWVGAPGAEPLQLVRAGTPTAFREADAAAVFALPEFIAHVDLALGDGETTLWTTDLTHEYVTINADYRT
ncbi:MAG: bifunctional glutamate N-acetyltransferase/amino-acid acetyltransferase ArgJ [Anaerolineae bacterium]|nr:bifunctional glutamate N-acetyltransferase/amino-acid acetyltransferase ArgJ [Anaerolineae bacterium]